MRTNFAAWQLDPNDLFRTGDPQEQLAFLVRYAVLAPSSHNSQPWRFRVTADEIEVRPDFDRALPAADRRNGQLYVSLGCAVETLLIAADAYGLTAEAIYETDPNASPFMRDWARVKFTTPIVPRSPIPAGHRLFAIARRATNRAPHTEEPIPDSLLPSLWASASRLVEVHFVADERRRAAVADLVLAGGAVAMADVAFRRELAAYLLPNNSARPVGMTGATVGMGLVASWLIPKLLPRMNPRQKPRPAEVKLLKQQTTSFVIVASKNDDPCGWMEAGRTYMRLALDAEREGLTTNNLAAPVTPPEVQRQLAALIGTAAFPQMCFRLGYAERAMPHAPRLTAEQVIERRT